MCVREREKQRKEGWSRDYGLYTGNTTALNGSVSHLKGETEPSVWHRICFQEITAFFPLQISRLLYIGGDREKKDRESEWKSCAFLPNLCLHVLPQTSTQNCCGLEALITSACVFLCPCLPPASDKGPAVGQKEREGFIISGSGGDMNFPFSLLACQIGLIKTELWPPGD